MAKPSTTFSPGTLFVVSTPIGNVQDITVRALEVLRKVHIIATEDARVTAPLLERYGIAGTLTTYDHDTWRHKVPILIQRLREGHSVALVCDSGTPTVFDPGNALIDQALQQGLHVTALPGPSAALAALAVSGFSGDCFSFLGRVPRSYRALLRLFAPWRTSPQTLICFPVDGALPIALQAMKDALGPRRAVIAINLTEDREQIHRGVVTKLLAQKCSVARRQKVTVVIEGPRSRTRGKKTAQEKPAPR
jgi:16S rRNA (cytidine1402-2'-O)-methyltransferase